MRKYHYKAKKQKRKKVSRKFFWFGFLFGAILASAFYFFIFSSVFQIKEIRVSGDMKVPIEELRNIISEKTEKKIAFFNLKNILLTNLEEVNETILKNFPQIAKVTLEKKFPNVLAAQIEERKPAAFFEQDGRCFFIDNEGVIFKEVIGTESKMLKIKLNSPVALELGNEVIDKEKIGEILEINSKSAIPLEEILIVSEGRFNAKTQEGWEIYFNPQRDLAWQLEELSILLREKIPPEDRKNLKYIDLRFDKIYIYPEINTRG